MHDLENGALEQAELGELRRVDSAAEHGNVARAEKVAAGMRTGTVWINDYHMISPERPFGGYKQSGLGRELGVEGYNIYRQVKHVHTNPGGSRDNYVHFSALSANI